MSVLSDLIGRVLHRPRHQDAEHLADELQDTEMETEVQSLGCAHPEDDRIDARRMGAPLAWICRRCGYREGGA